MKKILYLCSLLIILIIAGMPVAGVKAMPPLPSSFYGIVSINGDNVPVGTIASAWINGVLYANSAIQLYEGETVYSLEVPGDDLSTSGEIEGGVQGDTVVFKIGEMTASSTAIWQTGTNVNLNLNLYLESNYQIYLPIVIQ
jgi:hypothetical protein